MSELVDLGVVDKRLGGLERPASPGVTSGLARALAERLDFDVLLVRIVLVFLTIFTGLGLAIYVWGTLLTPRVGHEPPITRYAPGFAQWNRTTQLLIIGGSSLLIGLLWGAGSAGTGIALAIAAIVAWLLISRRSPQSKPAAAESAAIQDPVPAPEADETYEAWQARMRGAVESHPAPTSRPSSPPSSNPPASPAPRRSWLGGLAVLGVGAVAGLVPVLLGVLNPLTIASSALGAMGLALVAWSLLRRSRRIPGLVLAVCLVMAATTAVLSLPGAGVQSVTGSPQAPGGSEFDYFNAKDVELDFSGVTDGGIEINAVLSEIRITLPEGARIEVNQVGSTVDMPLLTDGPADGLLIEINAVGSTVTGVYE